jgi:hypothetical protein
MLTRDAILEGSGVFKLTSTSARPDSRAILIVIILGLERLQALCHALCRVASLH